ncbi:MAG TPA: LytR C-terminal domain-containing protein [Pseudonocardiaceae bacterium]|jgi:hypothetical protein
MSVPEGTGARRPLRTGGLALIGLGAVAALIGVGVVVTGGEQISAGGRTPAGSGRTAAGSTAPAPARPVPSVPARSPAAAVPFIPGPAAPAVPAPPGTGSNLPTGDNGTGTGGKGAAEQGPAEDQHGRGELRVYNNSTIHGLAARAASDFTAAGWTVVEVGNYAAGVIPTATVYYQPDTDQRAVAEAVGAEFHLRVEPRFPGIANAKPGVIAIITNDYGT